MENHSDIKGKFLAVLVPPSLDSLAAVRRYVGAVARAANLDEMQTNDIKVAVSEAVANAVEHGAKDKTIHLNAEITDERIMIAVTNYGPLNRSHPVVALRPRGLGIPLMAALVDEIFIEGNRERTRVTLVVHLLGDILSRRS